MSMKRYIFLLLCCVALITAAGCVQEKDVGGGADGLDPSPYKDEDFDTSGDIVMQTEYEAYGPDAPWVAYTITSNTSKRLMYGDYYEVEVLMDGAWYQVKTEIGSWNAIAYELIGFRVKSDFFYTKYYEMDWPDAVYRIVKEVGGKLYYAEFRLGESPITAATPYGYTDIYDLPEDYDRYMAAEDGVYVLWPDYVNADKLSLFVEKVVLKIPAMLRTMHYTTEGDPIIDDIIYIPFTGTPGDRFLHIYDATRDGFGAMEEITEATYSYLCVYGGALDDHLCLSNCASSYYFSNYTSDHVLLYVTDELRKSGIIERVREMEEERVKGNSTALKVFYGTTDTYADICDMEKYGENITEEDLLFGFGRTGFAFGGHLKDENVSALTGIEWLDESSFALFGETSVGGEYLGIYNIDKAAFTNSAYGLYFTVVDDSLENIIYLDGNELKTLSGEMLYTFNNGGEVEYIGITGQYNEKPSVIYFGYKNNDTIFYNIIWEDGLVAGLEPC